MNYYPNYNPNYYNPNYSYNIPYNQNMQPQQTQTQALNGKIVDSKDIVKVTHAAMFSYGIDLSIEQEELFADLIATYGEEIIDITNALFKSLKER